MRSLHRAPCARWPPGYRLGYPVGHAPARAGAADAGTTHHAHAAAPPAPAAPRPPTAVPAQPSCMTTSTGSSSLTSPVLPAWSRLLPLLMRSSRWSRCAGRRSAEGSTPYRDLTGSGAAPVGLLMPTALRGTSGGRGIPHPPNKCPASVFWHRSNRSINRSGGARPKGCTPPEGLLQECSNAPTWRQHVPTFGKCG